MFNTISSRSDIYRELDSIIGRASSVIFGSGAIANVPISEMINFFGLNISVCNRSIGDMDIESAREHLDECVFQLKPGKIFLYFGDECLQPGFNADGFIEKYESLIDAIVEKCDSSIYLLSVLSDDPRAKALNARLNVLARDSGCNYIDLSDCTSSDHATLRLFKQLSHYMRDSAISFTDAMQLASI